MPREIWKTIVSVILFLIVLVIFVFVFLAINDFREKQLNIENLREFISKLENSINSQPKDTSLELTSLVKKAIVVPANSSLGKYCQSFLCKSSCLDSPYYLYVTFHGKHDPLCMDKKISYPVDIERLFFKTLYSDSQDSQELNGCLSYNMTISYSNLKYLVKIAEEKNTCGIGESVNNVFRDIR